MAFVDTLVLGGQDLLSLSFNARLIQHIFSLILAVFLSHVVCVWVGVRLRQATWPQTSWQSHHLLKHPFHRCGLCVHDCVCLHIKLQKKKNVQTHFYYSYNNNRNIVMIIRLNYISNLHTSLCVLLVCLNVQSRAVWQYDISATCCSSLFIFFYNYKPCGGVRARVCICVCLWHNYGLKGSVAIFCQKMACN